jgi:cyclophilin family peptidyl-prolyl cis-trans isomerase
MRLLFSKSAHHSGVPDLRLRALNASADGGSSVPTHTPPTAEEVSALSQEARNLQARIATKHGDIVFEFFPDDAPTTVAAFIKLARSGFYDGLTFHRVEPGFVVQGGCPEGTGRGGPGYTLREEFNARKHLQGTVAMARAQSPNSAGSQFYICLDAAPFLDRQYTVFGQVISGFDKVQKLKVSDKMERVRIEPLSQPK